LGKGKKNILRIGVTGGIGSGKSLVCEMFSKLGIPVLSADAIAKHLLQNDASLRRKLRSLLGPDSYSSDGSLDRAYVASRIFSDASLQRSVNRVVHPKVESILNRAFGELSKEGARLAIVEAALIYEAGYDAELDLVIVVDAPRDRRISLVRRRDGSRRVDVLRRMRAQLPVRDKLRRADYIIHNAGSKRDLQQSVRFLAGVLRSIAENP
jgi:dephospho-CoA kinase